MFLSVAFVLDSVLVDVSVNILLNSSSRKLARLCNNYGTKYILSSGSKNEKFVSLPSTYILFIRRIITLFAAITMPLVASGRLGVALSSSK